MCVCVCYFFEGELLKGHLAALISILAGPRTESVLVCLSTETHPFHPGIDGLFFLSLSLPLSPPPPTMRKKNLERKRGL